MGQIINCTFNLFQEGRKYTGHHRSYILESAIKTCYAPETRERMRLREMLGYYGHGRRELAKKLLLPEVATIKLPDGSSLLVENIPSNVTTAFEVAKDGTVTHSQELTDTDQGKAVAAMNASRIGGFSWACGGSDGGALSATRVSSCVGFDYVNNPGFSANRGYILESADAATRDMILESICKQGVDEQKAESLLSHWSATAILEAAELQERLEAAAIYEDSLREQLEGAGKQLQTATTILEEAKQAADKRKEIITECASKSVIAVPAHVLESMISMAGEADFHNIMSFYESASRVDLSGLPLAGANKVIVKPHTAIKESVEFGSARSACAFE